MGVISSNNFDPTRRYVGVRLQQGVPIVDRDWNEMEDIRKFELRAFLKCFIGDGVPSRVGVSGGNDAFKIDSPGGSTDANDFIIHAGGGTTPPAGVSDGFDIGLFFEGTFLAGGMAAVIRTDMTFTSQPLHTNQAGASALAAAWGVPVIQALSLPTDANKVAAVYLDVWDRLVTPTEDPGNLILPGLGTESCARTRREWAVRVRTLQISGSSFVPTAPMPGDPDYLSGHGYSMLASIVSQTAGSTMVNPGDITDRRQTRLNLVELVQRVSTLESLLVIPAFDPSPNQFSPPSGALNSFVTLHGRNFTLGTPQVVFGSNPGVPAATIAPIFTGTNLEIKAQVPQGVSGNVTITVTTAGGTVTSQDTFVVIPPPVLSQFSPTSMFANSPVQVTINGNNLAEGNISVGFNALDASNNPTGNITSIAVFSSSPTQIVTAPTQNLTTLGNYKILVQNNGGSVLSDDIFSVQQKPKESKETKEKDKEKETKEHIKDKDVVDKTKDAAEKTTDAVRPLTARKNVSSPSGLPPQVTEGSDATEPPPGQAFISPEERPDVGADVLKQADEEADQEKGASE